MSTLATMKLGWRGCLVVAVSSMEQIIGAGLSTVIGIMLPMMQLVIHPEMSSTLQGIVGATGLVGIAFGSMIIGKLCDRQGYLGWFRACPVIIAAGALICVFLTSVPWLIAGLFIAGFGVGGGYTLDSAYISELLPRKWRQVMVGVAKTTSSLGFIAIALICWAILRHDPNPHLWNRLMLIIVGLASLTFLMRLRWAESPKWLVSRGRLADARRALALFYGPDVELGVDEISSSSPSNSLPSNPPSPSSSPSFGEMFRGENLKRVIYSGIPWACEGLAVYGFGVFLPVLVMALGIESGTAHGMARITDSVEVTALVNFFILPGFVIGLLIMNRFSHVKMLGWGFIGAAAGLALLLVGYLMHLPHWVLIAGFIIFEVTLNAGPHLITYIIPTEIFPVADRGTGTGIAAMNGKIGAITGVVIMPILLHAGGPRLVLIVSIAVMLLGSLISFIYGKAVGDK